MIKKITIILSLVCIAFVSRGQWPSLNLYSAAGQVQIRNNINYAVNRATDSLGKLLRAEFKKQLADSMAALIPADNKTIVIKDGKFSALPPPVDTKPIYDSILKVQSNLNTVNTTLTNNQNILSGRVTTTENKVSSLEAWRTETNATITTINGKIATIPKTAVSTTTTISTSTTTTELKP